MPSRFLSDEQLARYGSYAGDPSEEQLARHFHLDAADCESVGTMRGAHNRLGFAVQLGTARFLGVFLDDRTQTSPAVISAMARQLGEVPPCLDVYRDGRQRWRHAAAIRAQCGFRDLEQDPVAGFRLTRWLYVLCWTEDDRPGLLFDRATTWLLAHKVLLPGVSTLERRINCVRHRAILAALFQTLEATALDNAVELFDALATDIFSQAEEAYSKSRLRSLRDLDAAAMLLRDVGQHVVSDDDSGLPLAGWKAAVFEQVAKADIQAAMASVDSLVTKPGLWCIIQVVDVRRWLGAVSSSPFRHWHAEACPRSSGQAGSWARSLLPMMALKRNMAVSACDRRP